MRGGVPGWLLIAALVTATACSTSPKPVTPNRPLPPATSAPQSTPGSPARPPATEAPRPGQAPSTGTTGREPGGAVPSPYTSGGSSAPLSPLSPLSSSAEAIRVKVGLASDLPAVTLPCCDGAIAASVGGQVLGVLAPLRIEPAAGIAQAGTYRLQVAALRDEKQAQDLAARLEKEAGEAGEAHFDAGIDLYRVRLGRYSTREEADRDIRRLGALGVTQAFVVYDGGAISSPALRVTLGGETRVYPGRWLAIDPLESASAGIRVQGKRYRGRILVYLNDRGMLNLINELPVEDYLRGVVPSEMGPEQYHQLEALKAQAVAARTYTLRNLGEFAREGYDICATPRCQVYGGMEVEHPFSDRAVAETEGQVLLYNGDLVDALYSSTCGGHTEDVQVMFPYKDEPYLKGVPCLEEGFDRMDGDLPAGTPFPAGISRRLLPLYGLANGAPAATSVQPAVPAAQGASGRGAADPRAQPAAPRVLASRLAHLALLAGLPAPDAERLTSLDRREVQRFIASTFDMALDSRLLIARQDVAYLLANPPGDWSEEDRRRAAYLVHSGLMSGPPDQPLREEEIERTLLALAELLRVVRREEVTYLSLADGNLTVSSNRQDISYALPERFATFSRRGQELSSSSLALVPGDKLTLFWQDERLLGVIQDVNLEGVAFDRSSQHSSWSRFHTDSQMAAQVAARFPGLGFRSFEILERGVSGRVGKIRIDGDGGRTALVDGLAIRWTLDVPDTLFTVKRLAPPNKEPGWLFSGRGWGHGVGMCQVGAYGLAQRGQSYRDILYHYYTGVELGHLRGSAPSHPGSGGGGGG